MIADQDEVLLGEYYRDRAKAVTPPDATVPRRQQQRGRPSINIYLAAELAYMSDIEGRPECTQPARLDPPRRYAADTREPDAPFSSTTLRGYVDPALQLPWDGQEDRYRSATLKRWRRRGRHVLAELGAWPWALEPQGRVGRHWSLQEHYWRALAAWEGVEFNGALVPSQSPRTRWHGQLARARRSS